MAKKDKFPGEFQKGDLIGGTFLVLDYLGAGAMGHLYHVRHAMLNGEFALKTLDTQSVSEVDWKRFQNETTTTATMQHPNVVTVYNSGFHNKKLPFYVMDLLRGRDLGKRIKASGPIDFKDAIPIFLEVCAGISYAHKKGIIHRDIKPGNIYLLEKPDASGARVKVVDFGVAKLTITKNQDMQSLTGVGDVVGTPYYMSPEQCMAERVDARSDVYSLGCTLFEALTGTLPFRGRNPTEIMILHQSEPPPTLQKASGGKQFPPAVEQLVEIALKKEPAERFQTMDQFASALLSTLEGEKQLAAAGVTAAAAPPPVLGKVRTPLKFDKRPFEDLPEPAAETMRVQAAPVKSMATKLWLTIVAPTVAGMIAIGGLGYWHFKEHAKKYKHLNLDEQIKRIEPQTAEKLPEAMTSEKTDYERATAELEHAKTTESLQSKEPFSKEVKENGKTYLVFDFPKDVVIGQMKDNEKWNWQPASGELKFKKDAELTFKPSRFVATDPECLKRFRPGEIHTVELQTDSNSQVLRAMVNIADLEDLDCSQTKHVTELSAATLNHFPKLENFTSPINPVDGRQLAQAKCWDNIEGVYIQNATDCSPFIKTLQGAKKLRNLGLANCNLAYADYKALGTLTALTYLSIPKNPLTSRELAALTSLSEVVDLEITETDVDISALQSLKQFKKLKNLYISSPKLTSEDFQTIKDALPKIKVRESSKKKD